MDKQLSDLLFGKIAIEKKFITEEQLKECQEIVYKLFLNKISADLIDIIKKKNYMTEEQINEVLKIQRGGDTEEEEGYSKTIVTVRNYTTPKKGEFNLPKQPESTISIKPTSNLANDVTLISLTPYISQAIPLKEDYQKDESQTKLYPKESIMAKIESQVIWKMINQVYILLDVHAPYVKTHSIRVAKWTRLIAEQIPTFYKERINRLGVSALLHDCGILDIPIQILNKKTPLTEKELELVKLHPFESAKRVDIVRHYLDMNGILWHHLNFDGTGYPSVDFKGHNIPLEARIINVVNVFDSLTSDRPYRKAISVNNAFDILKNLIGKRFDPLVFMIFEEVYKTRMKLSENNPLLINTIFKDYLNVIKEFLYKKIGKFNPESPLDSVSDRRKLIIETMEYLTGLYKENLSREDIEVILQYALKIPIKETIDWDDINLQDRELEKICEEIKNKLSKNERIKIVLPLKKINTSLKNRKFIVFYENLWNFILDEKTLILVK